MLERVWRKGNPLTLLVGMQTSTATLEKDVFYLQPAGLVQPSGTTMLVSKGFKVVMGNGHQVATCLMPLPWLLGEPEP